MRVLMVIPSFLPSATGGAEYAVLNISKALVARGVDVEILTFNLSRRWRVRWANLKDHYHGLTVYRWGGINPTWPLERTRIRNIAGLVFGHQIIPRPGFRRLLSDFDVIHFHDEVSLSLPFYALPGCRVPRVFHIRTLVQKYEFFRRSPVSRWILRRAGDLFIADSAGYMERLVALGVDPACVRILRKGVDLQRFRPSETAQREDIILFVGRLDDPLKGADILLKAMALTSFRGELHLFGGTFEETPYVTELRRMAAALEKKMCVRIHRLVSQEELVRWYQRACLLVHPARLDSLPNAVLEAMACGTPVVTSRVGGLVELTETNCAAVGVEPGSVQALASVLDELITDQERLLALGESCRQLVENRFSFDSYVSNILSIYSELVGQYSGGL